MPARFATLALFCLAGAVAVARADEPDVVIADFEGTDYGGWTTAGSAFGPGPARGTLPGQMPVTGFEGKGLVNSFHSGDGSTGTLTSPQFTINRKYLAFLIGGGGHAGKTCMNLRVEGKVVRTAAGPNLKPGGSEELGPGFWDVGDLIGKSARIRIVDEATGGWGHVNVDSIRLTDKPPSVPLTNPRRHFIGEHRYLHIPVKNGAKMRKAAVIVDGKPEREFDVELADAKPDWWAFLDVSAWRGKRFDVQVDKLPSTSEALASISQGDSIKGAESLYREPLRTQFHFSARRGWNNDPNGLVYHQGEYHLFFQHNPYGWNWGNMHWGHAVSRDLVHWEELPEALYPDPLGPMFSGSAVVDWKNTSGFGKPGGVPPLVLAYTAAGDPAVQCLAYSDDRGRTFTKFSGNPVVKNLGPGNRDPKVFRHEPTGRWVMALYVELPGPKHTIHFLTSQNLKDWTVVSKVEGFFECPDFFELAVDDDPAHKKWVLTAASSEYMVGTFDGREFKPETAKLPGHRGTGFYAAQTFSDIPAADGRRIQIGWLQAPTPGMPFNQAMSVPMELKLRSTADGPRLTWRPVKELESLRQNSQRQNTGVSKRELVEVRLEFEPRDAKEVRLNVRGVPVVYDVGKQEVVVNGRRAPAPLVNGRQRLTVLADRSSLEVFASDGLTYVPMPFLFKPEVRDVELSAKGAGISQFEINELRSAWPGGD